MPYKFKCDSCGKDIVINYCKKGEIVKCKTCGAEVVVPTDCEIISNDEYLNLGRLAKVTDAETFVRTKKVLPNAPVSIEHTNKENKTDTGFHFKMLLCYGQIMSLLGWLFVVFGILIPLIGYLTSWGDLGKPSNYVVGSAIAISILTGISFIVSGETISCFVAIERNTRSTFELLKAERQERLH
jgi:hypothetical protein